MTHADLQVRKQCMSRHNPVLTLKSASSVSSVAGFIISNALVQPTNSAWMPMLLLAFRWCVHLGSISTKATVQLTPTVYVNWFAVSLLAVADLSSSYMAPSATLPQWQSRKVGRKSLAIVGAPVLGIGVMSACFHFKGKKFDTRI